MLQNVVKTSYVCGISSKRSPDHRKFMEQLGDLIRADTITTPRQAKDWIDQQLAE